MTIAILQTKREKIYNLCVLILNGQIQTIRTLVMFVGNIVATFPAVTSGPFFYRSLEEDKISALKLQKENFDKPVIISDHSKE